MPGSVTAALLLLGGLLRDPQLPPPPVPAGNPITEPKRILGKILFWDEQLSSDGTVACGTCHHPGRGGSDPRPGIHPGPDGVTPSADDVVGSPGVVRRDARGVPVPDPLFGWGLQVTSRSANSVVGAAYAPQLFHDGRASGTFVDPETGEVRIASGGALESQAVEPVLSHVEMARDGRTWTDVEAKLAISHPLEDATDLPPDLAATLAGGATYPDLFAAAFGDPALTAQRIAFAIATYERTLVADRTPWDKFMGEDAGALTQAQTAGWNFFRSSLCAFCHTPPAFTDHGFHNIGIRPPDEDLGRQNVTGNESHRGRFKTPTLRNAALKATFMHNGRLTTMLDAVLWYRADNPDRSDDNLDGAVPTQVPEEQLGNLVDFLTHGLTDPRVAAETFPFDRPALHGGALPRLAFASATTLQWPPLAGVRRYNLYRGTLQALRTGGGDARCVTDPQVGASNTFQDTAVPEPGEGFFYLKAVVDGTGAERGLGTNSAGVPRTVPLTCPEP
ncbi:MAG TPA: cytochrome c peroxidase [Candidatus Polarisedimenticolaceae bacterium]|nr:cytochrome c peroxidase [Candidatus Polarisedimenticolaceae bacterium]